MKPEDVPECFFSLSSLWWFCVHGLVVDCVVCALRIDVASQQRVVPAFQWCLFTVLCVLFFFSCLAWLLQVGALTADGT